MSKISLQDQFGPHSICFGCGPANKKGLQLKSFPVRDSSTNDDLEVIAEWMPEEHHQAFTGMLNGGIIGALLDCHSNWTAAWAIKNKLNLDEIPSTVTAEFKVKLLKPTPSDSKVLLKANPIEWLKDDRVWIEAELYSSDNKLRDKPCATSRGLFVAVYEGHPAYHRWN